MNKSEFTDPLTFRMLLEHAGIDPAKVKIARHLDTQKRVKVTPYNVWLSDGDAFLRYNKIQQPKTFDGAEFIASFVVSPANETVFTGIFRNKGQGVVPKETYCPVTGVNRHGTSSVFYDLEETEYLADYRGRLVIDWGKGWRSWAGRPPGRRPPAWRC